MSSLSLAFGCSLQDFDPLVAGVGLGGAGGEVEPGGGGNGGSSSSGGRGGSGGSGGSAGDGGTAGATAGEGGTAGTGGGGNGGNAGSTTDPGELMTDPSFEASASGWAPFGPPEVTLTRVSIEPRTGTTCLVCESRTTYWNGAGFPLTVPVRSNETYLVSAWVRLAGELADGGPPPVASTTLSLTLKTRCDDETDDVASYDQIGSVLASDTWVELTGTTLPLREGCEAIRDHRVYIAEPAGGEKWPDFFIDDVSLRLVGQ